jgi:hypothetical protein
VCFHRASGEHQAGDERGAHQLAPAGPLGRQDGDCPGWTVALHPHPGTPAANTKVGKLVISTSAITNR